MTAARSYLFVPANRPDRYAKALASGADAVIVDLEDAVAPNVKDLARDSLCDWLAQATATSAADLSKVWVRVNAADTPWHADDLACLVGAPIAGIVLPKAEDCDTLANIARGQLRLLPLIETALGVTRMRELAQVGQVERLVFGSIDLQVDLGMQSEPQESELTHLRVEMVITSRLANIAPPVDGVTTSFDDTSLLEQAVVRARRLGFGAKLCIHPRQVAPVNRGFLPDEQELAWARAVMAAVGQSNGGAISLNGKMIDKPVIMQAERLLRRIGETSN